MGSTAQVVKLPVLSDFTEKLVERNVIVKMIKFVIRRLDVLTTLPECVQRVLMDLDALNHVLRDTTENPVGIIASAERAKHAIVLMDVLLLSLRFLSGTLKQQR